MRTALAVLLFATLAAGDAGAASRIVTVGPAPLGPLNRDLGGTTQGSGDPAVIAALAAVAPATIRVDMWLDQGAYDCVHPPDFSAVDERVRNARRAGAEPLVIVDYMPACLSRYRGPSFGGEPDPKAQPPADARAWNALVRAAVDHLASTAGLDVRRFEAWNEPNLPQFFQGTLADYLDLFDGIHDAVASVAAERRLPLEIGGPAIAFPDPTWLAAFLAHVVDRGERLDFVSWHWYASYPLFGPLVGTPPFSVPPANVPNPLLKTRDYADQTAYVRALVHAAWSGRADPEPKLWIDEWNLNAGRDARHDTSEDAAFAASALDWMLRGGLDRASFFNVQDAVDANFNQGMFFLDGRPKPVYATFRFWSRLAGERITAEVGPVFDPASAGLSRLAAQADDVGVIATRSGGRMAVLLYNWSPRFKRSENLSVVFPRPVAGGLEILPASAATAADVVPSAPVAGSRIPLVLDDSSVAFLDVEER